MRLQLHKKLLTFTLAFFTGVGLIVSSQNAVSQDIDLFVVDTNQTVNTPNVLIILDNSANWSRQAQQWTGCEEGPEYDAITNPPPLGCTPITQGQSEARALQTVLNNPIVGANVNMGLMLYRTTGASSDQDNGYVRSHIRPMSGDTANVNTNKGYLSAQLQTMFNNINDPIEKRPQGNPFSNLMWEMYNYLGGLGSIVSGSGTPASRADAAAYTSFPDTFRSPLASTDSCTRTIVIYIANNTQSGPTADTVANKAQLEALGGPEASATIPFANFVTTETEKDVDLGTSTACFASVDDCTTVESAKCPDTYAQTLLDNDPNDIYNCSCTAGTASSCGTPMHYAIEGRINEGTIVSGPTQVPAAGDPADTVSTGEASKCQNNSPGAYTCPATSTTRSTSGNQTTVTQTSWANCSYVENTNACGNNNNKSLWVPTGDRTVTTTVYNASFAILPQESTGCYISNISCTAADYPASCSDGTYDSCTCTTATNDTGCTSVGDRYDVTGKYLEIQSVQSSGFNENTPSDLYLDEWAKYLRSVGVPIPGTSPVINAPVTTYTIDVFNAQQHEEHSALLFNAARNGGGKYFQAKNERQIVDAILEILSEAQAVNTAFSSASLPVNATNRAQNENQVFIGLFRPDLEKKPLWFGNLKRFQLIQTGNSIVLGDFESKPAINPLTGFLSDCSVSWWTSDSGNYWNRYITDFPDAKSICGTAVGSEWSDSPDGPFVEKGAAAQIMREANDPAATPDADDNYAFSRNIFTLDNSNAVVPFATPITGLTDDLVNYTIGHDTKDEDGDVATTRGLTEARSTIHGDVIHSRPQPVNFGNSGIVIYYGANDGTYKAINANTGVENWSFVAPEHYPKLQRLKDNSQKVRFFGDPITFGAPKDYFFDGSTGLYQNADNSDVWIYPSMRRGGRMYYAFDVSNNDGTPKNPSLLWKVGCPNPGSDATGCTAGFSGIGQSWAQPNLAFIKGYNSGTKPVAFLSGGYDTCEDDNTSAPSCVSPTGSGVYVVDAETGALLQHFNFGGRSVAADVALIDINQDELVDFGYAVDTGGNVYRFDLVDSTSNFAPVSAGSWTSSKIAQTNDSVSAGRKFLFPPALFQSSPSQVYLAIGSGDREHPLINNYPATEPVLNRFYVFKDDLYEVDAATYLDLDNTTPDAGGTNYMEDYSDPDASPPPGSICDNQEILPNSAASGWFIDLDENGAGEQTVTSAVIASGLVFFSTNRATSFSNTACTNSLGEARGYILNLLNGDGAVGVSGSCGGDRSGEFIGGGLPPSPVLSTVPVAGVTRTIVIGAVQKDGTVSSAIDAQAVDPFIAPIRRPVYWFKSIDSD